MKKLIITNIQDNIYYKNNPIYFNQLKDIVENNNIGFSKILKNTGYKKVNGKLRYNKDKDKTYLLNWINDSLPLLKDPKFSIATKCHWIFNNITQFPICPTCNSNEKYKTMYVGIFGSYQLHCCNKCAENDPAKKQKSLQTLKIHYGNNLQKFKEKISKSWKEHIENDATFIKSCCEKRDNTRLKIYNNKSYTNRDKAKKTCNEHYGVDNPFSSKEIQLKIKNTIHIRYGCDYALQAKSIRNKSIQTCLEKYGVKNVAQSAKIRSKINRKYTYNNIQFDSGYEICFYEYLMDKHIKFQYHPNIYFEYLDKNGKVHRYEPDFLLLTKNVFVELKGKNHFCNNMPIFNNKYSWEEKYNCLKKNNVIIYTEDDLQYIFKYIQQKHNMHYKKYVKQFRNI